MNAKFIDVRRSAFTLVELLVVVGLMAMLATVSIAGYSAVNRGMADRGALQSAVSTLRVAQQTCLIDRVPTKVLFFNQKIVKGSATAFQGTAIAIKQAGRITMDPQSAFGMLVDEFADWDKSYPVKRKNAGGGGGNRVGMRFFSMRKSDESKGFDKCSTLVNPYVTQVNALDDCMIQRGMKIEEWCKEYAPNNNVMYGFEAVSGSVGDWKAGDPYGIEIARIDLPKGYIFGNDAPKGDKLDSASIAAVTFDPEDGEPSMSGNVPISLMRPATGGSGGFTAKLVGTISADMLKDTFK